jgi:hypothetical protein
MYDDSDDDIMPFDPAGGSGPPMIDPDNFDMMSLTSRKNRKMAPADQSQVQFRKNAEAENSMMSRAGRFRPAFGNGGRQRSSQSAAAAAAAMSIATLGDNILDDPMMSYSSNRYGNVDRGAIAESRTNSLTSQRLEEMQYGPGPGGHMGPNGVPRRTSQSPAAHFVPQMRGAMPALNGDRGGRPMQTATSPGGYSNGGYSNGGRPSPPQMPSQLGRFPDQHNGPPHGNGHLGPRDQMDERSGTISLTGSASASANSGDSHPSAESDQSAASHPGMVAVGVR